MSIRLIATGDSLFSSRNLKERLPEKLLSLFKEADFAFTNAEFTTPKAERPVAAGRGYVTSVRPDILQEFADLNIAYVSFANNHSGDFGIQGMQDTLEAAAEHGLKALGLANSLYEARAPQFYDGAEGRVAIITVAVTRSEVFAASDGGNGVPPRPGVNPLRFESIYVLPEKEYKQLEAIDYALGTRDSMLHGSEIETFTLDSDKSFQFGALFEKNIQIEKGSDFRVKTLANARDREEILQRIQDARKRADYVVVNFHSHEGKLEDWYHPYAADFIEDFAKASIDAGADVLIGHGAHMFRGVEIYKEKPILYNLGSLLMEFEAGESIIPPEMYEAYGYPANSLPSDLHSNRAQDENGKFIGFNSDPLFSWNLIAELSFGEKIEFRLLPIDLDLQSDRVTQRGIPQLVSQEVEKKILERLNSVSQAYGTEFVLQDGWLVLKSHGEN